MWYRIYKLSDEFNVSESYNYYLVDQTSYQSLDSEHNHVIYKKLFNNIKFMWLNIGVDFEAQVNELVPTQRLMEYNPKVMLTDYTYSTTVGGSFGTSINSKNEVGVTGNATYSRTVSYSTNDRKLVDKSRMNEDYLGTSYSYNCFTVKDTDAWDYVWKYLVAGNPGLIWATMTGGTVKHKDNFETFLSEMVEYSTFIVRIPKNENYFKIELSCTSNQLYIDYDYKNSHNFESVKASKVISIYNK